MALLFTCKRASFGCILPIDRAQHSTGWKVPKEAHSILLARKCAPRRACMPLEPTHFCVVNRVWLKRAVFDTVGLKKAVVFSWG